MLLVAEFIRKSKSDFVMAITFVFRCVFISCFYCLTFL